MLIKIFFAFSLLMIGCANNQSSNVSEDYVEENKLPTEKPYLRDAKQVQSIEASNTHKKQSSQVGKAVFYENNDSRLESNIPKSYRITVHQGLILPFKPEIETSWDGVDDQVVENSAEILADLGKYSGPKAFVFTELTKFVLSSVNKIIAPPDPYIVFYLDNAVYETRTDRIEDDFDPNWEIAVTVTDVQKDDSRVLYCEVYDADLAEDDFVGSFEIHLKDIYQNEGKHLLKFFDENGHLEADGLLAVELSVEEDNVVQEESESEDQEDDGDDDDDE